MRISRILSWLGVFVALSFLSVASAAPPLHQGRRISVTFHKTEIRHVLSLFSELSGLNFVLSDDVKGQVTLRLRNVPWEKALGAILKIHRLGIRYEGSIALIAPLAR